MGTFLEMELWRGSSLWRVKLEDISFLLGKSSARKNGDFQHAMFDCRRVEQHIQSSSLFICVFFAKVVVTWWIILLMVSMSKCSSCMVQLPIFTYMLVIFRANSTSHSSTLEPQGMSKPCFLYQRSLAPVPNVQGRTRISPWGRCTSRWMEEMGITGGKRW